MTTRARASVNPANVYPTHSSGFKELVEHSFPARVAKRYLAAQGGNWAVIVAWNALFAFFPIVLVAIAVLGFVFRGVGLGPDVQNQVMHAFPDGQGRTVVQALDSFKTAAGPLAVVSVLGLLWSGSALFGAIDQALNALQPCKSRDFLPQRLMAFAMIFLFTVLIIPAVTSSTLLNVIGHVDAMPAFLRSGPAGILLQMALGVLDGTLLFGTIFFVVPNRTQSVRDVLPGALTAAALFEGLTLAFPLYFRVEHGFSTYGATFALFFLILTYVYLTGQILVIGGTVNAEIRPPETPPSFPTDAGGLAPRR